MATTSATTRKEDHPIPLREKRGVSISDDHAVVG